MKIDQSTNRLQTTSSKSNSLNRMPAVLGEHYVIDQDGKTQLTVIGVIEYSAGRISLPKQRSKLPRVLMSLFLFGALYTPAFWLISSLTEKYGSIGDSPTLLVMLSFALLILPFFILSNLDRINKR